MLIEFAFLDFTFSCHGPFQPPWEEYDHNQGSMQIEASFIGEKVGMYIEDQLAWDPPELVMIGVEATKPTDV